MIIINGIIWKIKHVPPGSKELIRSDGVVTVGMTDLAEQTIYIDNSISSSFFKKVLCHEITHAAMFSYNIDLTVEQEEVIADLIATYGEEIIIITNKVFNKLKQVWGMGK